MNQRLEESERRKLDPIQAKGLQSRLNDIAALKDQTDRLTREMNTDVAQVFELPEGAMWRLVGDELILYDTAGGDEDAPDDDAAEAAS